MRHVPSSPAALQNAILKRLPGDEWALLRRHVTTVRPIHDQVLIEQAQPLEHVFFLEEGIAALVAEVGNGCRGVQVGMIGREGLVGGLALIDGADDAYTAAVMVVPGIAFRVPVADLRQALPHCPVLQEGCREHYHALTRQCLHMAARTTRSTLLNRCISWLLMANERMGGEELSITHEDLARLLGVRRSGVTVATSHLQDEGLIEAGRGRIRVVDADGMQAMLDGRGRRRVIDGYRSAEHRAPA